MFAIGILVGMVIALIVLGVIGVIMIDKDIEYPLGFITEWFVKILLIVALTILNIGILVKALIGG